MDNAAILDLMVKRLGNRPNHRNDCLEELREVINGAENGTFLPWFLEHEWSDTLAMEETYRTAPGDFLREVEEGSLRIYDPNSPETLLYKPKKLDISELRDRFDNCEPGLVKAYALHAGRIYWGPKPNLEYPFTLSYYQSATAIDDDSSQLSTKWVGEGRQWIVYQALDNVANFHAQNEKMALRFRGLWQTAKRELFNAHIARQNVNREGYLGDK